MSDDEIIRQVLGGNRELFRKLVKRYQPMVFRTCIGFLHNKDDADDLTQEVFIQVYQSLSGFKGNASFSTWIYRIVVNASLNRIRKSSKKIILKRFETLFNTIKGKEIGFPVSDSDDPEKIIIRDEHREWVQKALNRLPEKQRTAIVLSKYDDLPQKEIASIMKISEGAVESLIQRAKANLRNELSPFNKKKKRSP
jgi:RNA polymerase sigma-70 factor (ECF subfamily)